jgi:hypothetical protein
MEDDEDIGEAACCNVCECKSSAIHLSCMEKLVNSKKSRLRPIEERTICQVCKGPFTVPFATHVLGPPPPTWYQRVARNYFGGLFGPPCLGAALMVALILLLYLVGGDVAFIALISLVVVLLCVLLVARNNVKANPQRMDDNRFYEVAVSRARDTYHRVGESSADAIQTADPRNVVLLLRTPPKRKKVRRRSRQRKPMRMLPFLGGNRRGAAHPMPPASLPPRTNTMSTTGRAGSPGSQPTTLASSNLDADAMV